MKANELRIGNWVIVEANMYPEPTYLDIQVSAKNIYDFSLNTDLFQPIQLTEEWLLKLGFERNKNGFSIGLLEIRGMATVMFGNDYSRRNIGWVRHVHELQNLYFVLTGNELTIKK